MFGNQFICSFEPEANLDTGMVLHQGYLLGGSYHGHDLIFLLNCYEVRWQVEDVKCLHFIEEGEDMFYVATYNKYGLEMHGYRQKSLMFWRCLLNITDRSRRAQTLPLVFVPNVYSTSQPDSVDLFIKDRECEVFIDYNLERMGCPYQKALSTGTNCADMIQRLTQVWRMESYALKFDVLLGSFVLGQHVHCFHASAWIQDSGATWFSVYDLRPLDHMLCLVAGRMFGREFITILEPGAKLVNGMLGRVGPDKVVVIGSAWSDFMCRNVDQNVRLLHFVKEGHDMFYVATDNKYGLENHAYKEASLMFWRCLLQNMALQLEKKSVPSIRITDDGSCAQPQEVQDEWRNMMEELDFQPGQLFAFTLLRRWLFHLTVFNESGEAVTESETYSSHVLRNTFFYLGRKPTG
ncbi:hypothetical protein Tco_0668886 [Tanacetum coccineum]